MGSDPLDPVTSREQELRQGREQELRQGRDQELRPSREQERKQSREQGCKVHLEPLMGRMLEQKL